jgi:hypothetical protein
VEEIAKVLADNPDAGVSAVMRILLSDRAAMAERVAGLERDLAKAKADVREMAMQAIADMGQYQENFERAEASEAEVARLREALERIAAHDGNGGPRINDPGRMCVIARAALTRPDDLTQRK